jgi:nucleoside-diphosphate-sugar epimerase
MTFMEIFVAGATGVLGRRAVPLLIGAGHQVTGIARSPEKSEQLSASGATPAAVDLFDAASLAAAVAGHEVVMNLATHIPDLTKAARSNAWSENDRIRTEGARNLVDAALATGASRYVQESICFFYVDGGDAWLDEDVALDAPGFASSFISAESEAQRFAASGGAAVVLRFGFFYGADSSHTTLQLAAARKGVSPFPGPKGSYQTFIHLDDAASAVVAALSAPTGIYNVTEDDPLTRREAAAALGAALGKRPGFSIPGISKVGGKKTAYIARSVRVSNKRFREATGWSPRYPSGREGWKQVVADVAGAERT